MKKLLVTVLAATLTTGLLAAPTASAANDFGVVCISGIIVLATPAPVGTPPTVRLFIHPSGECPPGLT
jgi:hypothetical protein